MALALAERVAVEKIRSAADARELAESTRLELNPTARITAPWSGPPPPPPPSPEVVFIAGLKDKARRSPRTRPMRKHVGQSSAATAS